ncbi:MAG: hypothetical protein AAF492_20410, partial [Verrucomicrobiota bacterium]
VSKGQQPDTENQTLRVKYRVKEADKSGLQLNVFYVSKGADQKGTELFGIRAKGGPGGYSNGSTSQFLSPEQAAYTHMDMTIARYIDTRFVGWRVELLKDGELIDKKQWEDRAATDALAKQIQLAGDWWYKQQQ